MFPPLPVGIVKNLIIRFKLVEKSLEYFVLNVEMLM